ncbi:hypothetical protein ACF0H5_002045 [Mactra antiquata]
MILKQTLIWILYGILYNGVTSLLLHTEDDLLSAYQTLTQQVQTMSSEMALMSSEMAMMKSTISKLQSAQGSSNAGANYVRWGRTSCPSNGTTLVYEGYAAGSLYSDKGAAANYLCLPKDPQWDYYEDSVTSGGQIYGAEYEFGNQHSNGESHFVGQSVKDEDVPCAVCSTQRAEVLMLPAKKDCYSGWTKEYSGYLMSGNIVHSATEFVCVDKQVEVVVGGHPDQNGRLFYLVEGICGSLKCPPYVNGRELTCVVCSR